MELTTELIRSDFNALEAQIGWSFKDVGRSETSAFTHNYHRYPAKFIPQIVKRLVEEFAPIGSEVICDPFGGCGTTLVEAKLLGRKSIGFDINPVAKLITQTKVTPIKPSLLIKQKTEFLQNYNEIYFASYKHHHRVDYWFDPDTVRELDRIYFAIKQIRDYRIRRFFMCAFSNNLKNCSRWLMKSIKPTIDKNKVPPNPMDSFMRHLDLMIKKNEKFYHELKYREHLSVPSKMYRRDSTKKLPLENDAIDLIITSPPYVTSYEYADLHQLSLIWFGEDLNNFKQWKKFNSDYDHFRRSFIGTSLKQKRKKNFGSLIAQQIVSDLTPARRGLATDVANYFSDMKKSFKEMYRILKPGAKACIIIGNTSLAGVEILNAQVTAEQMIDAGFIKVDFIKREVLNKMITPWRDIATGKFTGKNSDSKVRAYEYEYIVIMEKPSTSIVS